MADVAGLRAASPSIIRASAIEKQPPLMTAHTQGVARCPLQFDGFIRPGRLRSQHLTCSVASCSSDESRRVNRMIPSPLSEALFIPLSLNQGNYSDLSEPERPVSLSPLARHRRLYHDIALASTTRGSRGLHDFSVQRPSLFVAVQRGGSSTFMKP